MEPCWGSAGVGLGLEALMDGPHVVEALRALDDILRRMESHQTKKQTLLRRLRVTGTGAL